MLGRQANCAVEFFSEPEIFESLHQAFEFPTLITGATLGISFHVFMTLQGSDFIANFTGSSAKILEIHGFTGTQGTRPNAAPDKAHLSIHLKTSSTDT